MENWVSENIAEGSLSLCAENWVSENIAEGDLSHRHGRTTWIHRLHRSGDNISKSIEIVYHCVLRTEINRGEVSWK
jgi:hypothetical protein